MHFILLSKDKSGGKETIVPLKPGAQIGQRVMLSTMDCMKLNEHYGCFKQGQSQQWNNKKIQILCAFLGFQYENKDSNKGLQV